MSRSRDPRGSPGPSTTVALGDPRTAWPRAQEVGHDARHVALHQQLVGLPIVCDYRSPSGSRPPISSGRTFLRRRACSSGDSSSGPCDRRRSRTRRAGTQLACGCPPRARRNDRLVETDARARAGDGNLEDGFPGLGTQHPCWPVPPELASTPHGGSRMRPSGRSARPARRPDVRVRSGSVRHRPDNRPVESERR